MNVSLTEPMEKYVRQKVAVGEYETAIEVVREALRFLRQRDEVWKADVRSKITQGMESIRAGKTVPAARVKTEMAAFKRSGRRIAAFDEGLRTFARGKADEKKLSVSPVNECKAKLRFD